MRILILFSILTLSGCATVPLPGYISRVDHPYDRKINAGFEKVVSSTVYILKSKGWKIESEADPAIYERDDHYDNNGYQNLLIMTRVRKDFTSITSMHLNVLIHATANTCDVEIRYEARKPLIKQFTSERNDKIVENILDAIVQDVSQ
jgi:hypothetical protein